NEEKKDKSSKLLTIAVELPNMTHESLSRHSTYENVPLVRRPTLSFTEETMLASDSEEEEKLERKFQKFRQTSFRRRKNGNTAITSTFYTTVGWKLCLQIGISLSV
ncbi:hypothetical protein PENTCL1PPCAC_14960, partial [Pristionchus entomophagus]